jgi:hypothetical protein
MGEKIGIAWEKKKSPFGGLCSLPVRAAGFLILADLPRRR